MERLSERRRKIGVFDSGLGGLVTLRYITEHLPMYDYVYLGDTAHMPYGERNSEEVYQLARKYITELFAQDCFLVIVACNSISASALRRLQQEFLIKDFPERKILGVLIPLAEEVTRLGARRIGVLATPLTTHARAFSREIQKCSSEAGVIEQPAAGLAAAIEEHDQEQITKLLEMYLALFLRKHIDALVLGCTHYVLVYDEIRNMLPNSIKIISQEQALPARLESYIARHPELSLSRTARGNVCCMVTQSTPRIRALAREWFSQVQIEVFEKS